MQEHVISLALGDYHSAAMTEEGKLLTWGSYSDGALGLGDPAELPVGSPGGFETEAELRNVRNGRGRPTPTKVEYPSEVRFDWGLPAGSKKFVFSVAASGWHTGALVLDLDENDELTSSIKFDPIEDEEDAHSEPWARGPYPMPTIQGGLEPYQAPPFNPHQGPMGGTHPFLPPPLDTPETIPVTHGPVRGPRGRRPFGRIGFAGRGMNRGGAPTG